MNLELIIKKFNEVDRNIYDIAAIAYNVIVEAGERNSCVKYKEKQHNIRDLDIELTRIIELYSRDMITLQCVINKYVEVLQEGLFECEILCVELIHALDRFYEQKIYQRFSLKIKKLIGPLNSLNYIGETLIYKKPKDIFSIVS